MAHRNSFPLRFGVPALLGILLLTGNALAYVGPTPGPEFFGYFASLMSLLGVIFSSILLWPIHALVKRFKRTPPTTASTSVAPATLPQETTPTDPCQSTSL